MNLRDLKYLVALADYQHFGKAAQACCISQPTLSMQIKKLEEQLGVKLIERENKKFIMTPVGENITKKARIILHDAQQILLFAKNSRDPFKGEVNIGVIPTVAPYYLPRIIPSIQQAFPHLKLYIHEEQTHIIINQLKKGALDLLILALPLEEENISTCCFMKEKFYLAVPKNHHLSHQKKITPKDLYNENVLLLTDGHCLRDQALDICEKVGAKENTNFQASSIETIRQMVISGFGITLIPDFAINLNDNMDYIEFKAPEPYRSIGLAWRSTSVKIEVINEIQQHIQDIF